MPPYQMTPQQTQMELGTRGMEVAPDFIDNQCLTRFTDQAIDWIDGKKADALAGKPFFLYLPLTSPHYPVCPLPPFHGQGECGGYGEFVIETDHHVGRILSFLDRTELGDNTLILFTSDNGPERSWQSRIKEFGHHSNGPYRGGKRDIYEGGHRVPMFIRWPAGVKQPGRTWNRTVGQVDVFATLAEIVGAKVPDDAAEDSQSFANVLVDPLSQHLRLPIINHGAAGRFAITEGDWKLVMPHKRSKAELYDLATDPGETENMAGRHPDVVKALQGKITEIVCRGRTTGGTHQSNDTGYWNDLTWMTPEEYAAGVQQAAAGD